MIHCISIDWLALFCICNRGCWAQCPLEDHDLAPMQNYSYKIAAHGTRQFKHLVEVSIDNDVIAEVQYEPCSSILPPDSCIVKFSNRLLYSRNLWGVVDCFLIDHALRVKNISRVDVCADFHRFDTYEPVKLISDFLSSRIRHKGKGLGGAYFNHYAKKFGTYSIAHLDYSGLSFGSRESDARAYLYNKTLELRTQKDKPYIRDFWRAAGLNITKDVWRLEISIKSGGVKFKDKKTGQIEEYDKKRLKDSNDLCKLFYTYQRKLFSFVINKPNITNITREPIISLFADKPHFEHGVIRDVSCSTRTEKILIKQLWQMSEKYRGNDMVEDEGICKELATNLAIATDLRQWMREKQPTWEKPTLK